MPKPSTFCSSATNREQRKNPETQILSNSKIFEQSGLKKAISINLLGSFRSQISFLMTKFVGQQTRDITFECSYLLRCFVIKHVTTVQVLDDFNAVSSTPFQHVHHQNIPSLTTLRSL